MIGTILTALFKDWMLLQSDKFAKFIFGLEGYGFLILSVFVYIFIPDASLIVLIPLVVCWGAFNIFQYYLWQKKRADKNKETWNPNTLAKAALLICEIAFFLFGVFLIILSEFKYSKESIIMLCIGLVIVFGVSINLIKTIRKGFNSIEY